MPDPRFFTRSGPFSLSRLAEFTGAALQGAAPEVLLHDVAPLETAGAQDVSFLDNTKYIDAFSVSRAGACFVRSKFVARAPKGMALLVTEEPYAAFALASSLFYPVSLSPFISPQAHIASSATIGRGCRIEAGVWIGENVILGDACCIGANATISHAVIGSRVVIHPGVHIGQDGFGFALSKTGIIKVPQLGRVVIGNDVEIGAGTCIDRGAGPDTVIGDFCKIDNMVQIAHNCVLGKGVMVSGMTGLSGSTRVEDYAMLGGNSGTAGHLTIGKGAKLAARTGVIADIPPGETWGGYPAAPIRQWHRQSVILAKLAGKLKEQ